MKNKYEKYSAYTPVKILDRKWPNKTITSAPIWCSVDLRDGNQALIEPMDSVRKMRMFKHLVKTRVFRGFRFPGKNSLCCV